jgi:hypothetical protein
MLTIRGFPRQWAAHRNAGERAALAIQFECSGCGKAIEVDDDLAGRLVACPYCQTTVRAPAQGTLVESVPVAQPARQAPQSVVGSAPSTPAPWADLPVPPSFPALRSNPPGNFGLLAGLLAWGTMIVFSFQVLGLAAKHLPEPLEKRQPTQQELAEAMEKVMTDPANANRVMIHSGLLIVFGLASVALSIAGLVRRDARKGTSIAGLIIGGSLMLCMLAGMLLSVQAPRAG